MKFMRAAIVFVFACMLGATANASNYRFLDNTAVSHFNDQDAALMQKTIHSALDHNADGKKSSWSNPQSGASGYALPVKTIKTKNTVCRKLTVMNSAGNEQGVSTFTFCRIKGEWKIVQ